MAEKEKKQSLEEMVGTYSFLSHADETLKKDPWDYETRSKISQFYTGDSSEYTESRPDRVRLNIGEGDIDEDGVHKPGLKYLKSEIVKSVSKNLDNILASIPKELLITQLEKLQLKDKKDTEKYKDILDMYALMKLTEEADKGNTDAMKIALANYFQKKKNIRGFLESGGSDETRRYLYNRYRMDLENYKKEKIDSIDEGTLREYIKKGLTTLDETKREETYLEIAQMYKLAPVIKAAKNMQQNKK